MLFCSTIKKKLTFFGPRIRVTKNSYKALNLSKKLAFFEVGSEYAISPKKIAISDFTV